MIHLFSILRKNFVSLFLFLIKLFKIKHGSTCNYACTTFPQSTFAQFAAPNIDYANTGSSDKKYICYSYDFISI